MSMGIVTNEDFSSELSRLGIIISNDDASPINNDASHINNEESLVIEKEIEHGRGSVPEVASNVREFIARESLSGASPRELSESFGISKSSISAYKNGATSTSSYHNPNPNLKKSNDEFRTTIVGSAQSRLMAAIEAIDDDKLKDAKVNVASAVARDMSSIIKNISPELNNNQVNQQVIIFKPRMKEEDDYQTLEVLD